MVHIYGPKHAHKFTTRHAETSKTLTLPLLLKTERRGLCVTILCVFPFQLWSKYNLPVLRARPV